MAMFTPDPVNPSGEPLVYFIHSDHLNTPRVVVDRQNRVRWRWLAEPFGTSAPETDPSGLEVFTQNLRFPGQYADQESELFYNYHRYYAADGGRYTQSDPIGLAGGSVSTYGYVGGSPIQYVDALGLQAAPLTPGLPIPIPSAAIPGTPENKELQTATINGVQAVSSWLSNLTFSNPFRKKFAAAVQRACDSDNPCEALKAMMVQTINDMSRRESDMLVDRFNQYKNACCTPDPSSPKNTTWVGHQDAYANLKVRLLEIKAALDYYNCDYDKGLMNAYLGSVSITMPACEILKNGGRL